MQISTLIVATATAFLLVGCGLINSDQGNAEFGDGTSAILPAAPVSNMPAPTSSPSAMRERSRGAVASFPPAYLGPKPLETRILASPVIARVRLDSVSTSTEFGSTYQGMKYLALLEFNFSVLEYLKGSGAADIVAVWDAAPFFDTRQEAEAALPAIAASRDAQWDNHDAIVFLQHSNTSLPSTLQPDRFFLAWGGTWSDYGYYGPDDGYSIASRHNKLWLPADAAPDASSRSSGDQQRFLMDAPPSTGASATITLGEFKARVVAVAAKLAAGDDSEEYSECVEFTYRYEGQDQHSISTGGDGLSYKTPDQELTSGLAASSVVYESNAYGRLPDKRLELWFEGADADLFHVEFGDSVLHDHSGDNVIDSIRYDYRVVSARPLPDGMYTTTYNHRDVHFVPCEGYTYRHDWTITVTAPDGVLHEAFFDPVMDGTAVAADGANGVLKPRTFTGDASATIKRIAWDSGMAMLKVVPHGSVAGHAIDFIELDGTVSLSLNVDEATVDAASDTLTWAVPSQPWDDGDKLMVRIREARNDCTNGTAVPDPVEHPGLVSDCIALLSFKDALRGAAALNWGVDLSIADWDGVTVEGTPRRVTRLRLPERELDGVVPSELGSLTALTDLRLYGNQLTGEIPSELGGLTALAVLHLDDNRLTGEIPVELGSLTSLRELFLGRNQLEGEIPAELGGLTSLKHLNLDRNALTGEIPAQLESLADLQYLTMSGNQLTGSIPAELGSLGNLKDLFLNANQLTGSIPPELGRLSKLELLDLKRNRLTGEIPSELGDLTKLQWLYLRGNQLSGVIPSELSNLSNLETLWLSGNSFTDCIPSDLGDIADNDLDRIGIQYCVAR